MVFIFMLIVGKTMQIMKINGFCSIPEMIQAMIHPSSKFRSRIGLEITKNFGLKLSILEQVFKSKSSFKMKLKLPKQSVKYPLNVNEVCTRFPIVIRKECRYT